MSNPPTRIGHFSFVDEEICKILDIPRDALFRVSEFGDNLSMPHLNSVILRPVTKTNKTLRYIYVGYTRKATGIETALALLRMIRGRPGDLPPPETIEMTGLTPEELLRVVDMVGYAHLFFGGDDENR